VLYWNIYLGKLNLQEAGGQTSAASTKPAVTAPSETTVSNVKRTMVVNGTVAATAAGVS
jgi:hypothetical protein